MLITVWVTGMACGSPASGGDDGDGGDGGAGGDASLVASVVQPPVLTPCPTGWRQIDDGSVTWCDPWPASGRQTCGAGWAHFPGESGCVRIGTECPPDGWPTGHLSMANVLYVDPDSSAPSPDGSSDAPFATLAEAEAEASDGTTLLLAPGIYDGHTFSRPISLTVLGTCASQVIALGQHVDAGAHVAFENVWTSLTLQPGSSAEVTEVILIASNISAPLVGDSVVVAGAVSAFPGASVELDRVQVGERASPATPARIRASDGAQIRLSRASIIDDGLAPDGGPDPPVVVENEPGTMILDRAAICRGCLDPAGGSLTISDSIITSRMTIPTELSAESILAAGVFASSSALELERVTIEGGGHAGVRIWGGTASLRDILLRDGLGAWTGDAVVPSTEFQCPAHFGRGIVAEGGAEITAARVWLDVTRDAGVFAIGQDTLFEASDLAVVDTSDQLCTEPETFAADDCFVPACVWNNTAGLVARNGADMNITGFAIDHSTFAGAIVAGGADLTLTRGLVARNKVGVSVQDPDFPLDHLQNHVVWQDNDTNVDSAIVDIPPPLPEFICHDQVDNDDDDKVDCADEDCQLAGGC